jgi:enoyl-CoA hydratase/carnithine racemase
VTTQSFASLSSLDPVNAFTAGADLKTHAPEWQTVGPMVGRERIEDGMCGITREPLTRITKPIVAAINGWCVGHGVELAMACDIRIASERAQFGTFAVRRGMHPADGAIPRLLNSCGVGVTLELLLTREPFPPSGRTRRTWCPEWCHTTS